MSATWIRTSLTAVVTLVVLTGCRNNPRRDVGQVQSTIGHSTTDIYPRAELQGQAGLLAGPTTTPSGTPIVPPAPTQVAVVNPAAGGAQVPFATPPSDGLPEGAIDPIPASAEPFLVAVGPTPRVPGSQAPVTPQVPVPQSPVAVAQPQLQPQVQPAGPPVGIATYGAQPIPVNFATATTGSTFIPAGAVVPQPNVGAVPAAGVPVAGGASQGGMRLQPGAGSVAGAPSPASSSGGGLGFFSDQNIQGMRLQPKLVAEDLPTPAAQPRSPAAATPVPSRPPAAPATGVPASPPKSGIVGPPGISPSPPAGATQPPKLETPAPPKDVQDDLGLPGLPGFGDSLDPNK